MKPFTFTQPDNLDHAIVLAEKNSSAKYIAGGTNLVDLLREHIEQPDQIIDISRLPMDDIREHEDGRIEIGAMVRNSHMAAHTLIRNNYPFLSQAILHGASGQLRNMATTGGNIMQRTRCYYFYDDTARCNKRNPGSGCDAIDGFNRIHAILGHSASCIATHPSDMCVALTALGAKIILQSKTGTREVAFEDFHLLPHDTPQVETLLRPGELIRSVIVPPLSYGKNSTYRKVRDRASYAFALVSVACAIDLKDGMINAVRLGLGGVAHKPWRAHKIEKALIGKKANLENFTMAAESELAEAIGFAHNGFKIELAKRTIINVLEQLTLNK